MTPSKSTPLRAVGYIRVSTAEQAQQGESLSTQKRLIQERAQANKWKLLKIYEDAGISGAKNDRPALQALLQAAGRKELDAVIVQDLTRFGRSCLDLLKNVESLKEHGVRFVSIKEGIDQDNVYSRFFIQVLSAIAQLEREMIQGRMNENKMVRWKEKRIFNGSLPLGYTWNKTTQAIEILPEEAAVYRRIVDEYLDLGKSVKDIVLGLQKDHIPTRLKGRWAGPTLCQLLRNPAYYGLLVVNVNQPAAEHITFEAPPLISKARWDSIQERLDSSRQRAGRPSANAREYLLYGLLRCGHCGGKVVPIWGAKRADGTAPRYYGCHWRNAGAKACAAAGRSKCSLPLIHAEPLEGFIYFNHLMMRLGLNAEKHLSPLLDSEQWDAKIKAAEQKLSSIETQITRKQTALRNVDSLLEDPDFDPNLFKAKRHAIEAEIHTLRQDLSHATAEAQRIRKLREEEDLLAKFAQDRQGALKAVHKELFNLPLEGKQRLLRGMLSGPITIRQPEPGARFGDGGPMKDWLEFSFRFNHAILKEILDVKNRKSADDLLKYLTAVFDLAS